MDTMLAARRRTIARNALRRARDTAFTAEVRAELSRSDATGATGPGSTRDGSATAMVAATATRATRAAGVASTTTPVEDLGALAAPVLDHLDRWGPCEVAEIPYRWPLTRMHLRQLVRELVDAGLAEWVDDEDGRPARRVRLTRIGRRGAAAAATSHP
ncbi:MAG: hypothetical protein ACODAE_07070 [Gemmatimonadota bacterium]